MQGGHNHWTKGLQTQTCQIAQNGVCNQWLQYLCGNDVTFTSFREVSWGYERVARGSFLSYSRIPRMGILSFKGFHRNSAIHKGILGWDPGQNWVTKPYETLRNPMKTQSRNPTKPYETLRNPIKTLDPLTFVTFRNVTKSLRGTLWIYH